MPKKEGRLDIRISTELVSRLFRAAEVIDRPASQITREAISEKLAELAQKHPEIDEREAVAA